MVGDAVAIGAPHPDLGQAIILVVTESQSAGAGNQRNQSLVNHLKTRLPNFMVPHHIEWVSEMPRNANGKFDRPALAARFKTAFTSP
jgi:acyl-coenzyme A synthetase/AMP-(fatty) acid ligase